MPNLRELIDARVTALRPIQLNDYGFAMTELGVMLCKGILINAALLFTDVRIVVSLSSKTAGKNSKHSDITESSNISAVSLMGVQVFQQSFGTQFSMITENTSWFQTKGYFLIPSTQFLCVVDSKIQFRSPVMVEVVFEDLQRFLKLRKGEDALKTALKQFKKRADNHLEEF